MLDADKNCLRRSSKASSFFLSKAIIIKRQYWWQLFVVDIPSLQGAMGVRCKREIRYGYPRTCRSD